MGNKIKGYRTLSQTEIDNMNRIKLLGIEMGELVESLEADESTDKRWLEDGKIGVQKGIMSIVRSIAKPEVF